MNFHIKFLDCLACIQWYNNNNINCLEINLNGHFYQWWNDKKHARKHLDDSISVVDCYYFYYTKIIDISIIYLVQSLVYLPLAIANVLASRLNDGYVL